MFFNSIVIGSLSALIGLLDRSGRASHTCNILWGKLTLAFLGIRLDVSGLQHILHDRSLIIAVNHQSYMDIFIMLAALPLHFKFVSKASVFKVPFIGWAMKAAGYISINRKKTVGNRNSLHRSLNVLREGIALVIFPEGTIPSDTALGNFHPGAFSLAAKTGVPILPVSVSGTGDILPRHAKLLRPGRVRIIIHPPILPQDRKRGELRTATREAVRSGLENYSTEEK